MKEISKIGEGFDESQVEQQEARIQCGWSFTWPSFMDDPVQVAKRAMEILHLKLSRMVFRRPINVVSPSLFDN